MYKTIHLLTATEQSDYADLVCIENVNEDWMVNDLKNLDFIKEEKRFDEYLTTSVGNMAYMALHCRDNEVRTNCWALLHQYKLWRIRTDKK